MNLRPRRNLKSVVIEPFKQIKFGLYMIGVSSAFVVFTGFLFVLSFTQQYEHVMGIFEVVDPSLKWELVTNDVFISNGIRIGVSFAVYIGLMLTIVFQLTHRYYGPIVSINRFISEIKEGNYKARCTIRSKDELQDLVANLNEMAEQLEQRHESPSQDESQTNLEAS